MKGAILNSCDAGNFLSDWNFPVEQETLDAFSPLSS
jgi:hypothetical protein